MRSIRAFVRFFSFGAMVAGALFLALNYHFIFTSKDGVIIERKSELGFTDTFVNARNWGPLDYANNPRIGFIIIKHKIKR
jgi:hypothetical protein